jgi:hypothetical protein
MPNSNIETILTVMVGITALAILMQAFVLLAIFLAMRKTATMLKEQAEEFRASVVPVLHTSKEVLATTNVTLSTAKDLIARLEPKLDAAATDLADMAQAARSQTARLQASVDEIAGRVRQQAFRVDGMTTSVLNQLDRFGGFVNEAVNVPMRQVSGVVAAAKAIVDTLRAPAPPQPRRPAPPTHAESQATRTVDEKDLFV